MNNQIVLRTDQLVKRILISGGRKPRFRNDYSLVLDVYSDGTPKITANKETGERGQVFKKRHYATLRSVFIGAAKEWTQSKIKNV